MFVCFLSQEKEYFLARFLGKGLTARVFSLEYSDEKKNRIESNYVAKVFENNEYYEREMKKMNQLLEILDGKLN